MNTRDEQRHSGRDIKEDMRRDPAELEREADRARANVESTLEALERSFSPGELVDQVIRTVRDNGGDFGRNLGAQIRNNPLPTLLTGIGMTWLMAASDRPPQASGGSTMGSMSETAAGAGSSAASRASGAASSARDAAGHAGERARSAAEGARAGAQRAADATRGAADRVAGAGRSGAESAWTSFDHLRREQPLVLGALAVAAGAMIGSMLPRTAAEDQWLGATSDEAVERLREEGRRAAEQGKTAAAEAAESARKAAEPRRAERSEAATSAPASEAKPGKAGS